MVASPSRRCARALPLRARRVRALRGLVELLRVAQQDERLARPADTAMAFASENWPASSMSRTSTDSCEVLAAPTARPCRRRHPPRPRRRTRRMSFRRAPGGPPPRRSAPCRRLASGRCAADGREAASSARRVHDVVEQLADDLVAVGRDADLATLGDEVEDRCRAPVHVLPLPGGPWIGRHDWSSAGHERAGRLLRRLAGPAKRRARDVPLDPRRPARSRSRAARYGPVRRRSHRPRRTCPMRSRLASWASVGTTSSRHERPWGGCDVASIVVRERGGRSPRARRRPRSTPTVLLARIGVHDRPTLARSRAPGAGSDSGRCAAPRPPTPMSSQHGRSARAPPTPLLVGEVARRRWK